MDVNKIEEAAVQYAEYITKIVPQVKASNLITYYFSGSLAMDLISSALSLKQQHLDKNGNIVSEGNDIQISNNSREMFRQGVRPISFDIDTVSIDYNTFNGQLPIDLGSVRRECDKATILCPNWTEKFHGRLYFDALEGDRIISEHFIAILTMAGNKKIVISDPVYMLMHKLNEFFVIESVERKGIFAESNKIKIQKDIRDFSCLFNGLAELKLIPENMIKFLREFFKYNNNKMYEYMYQNEHEFISKTYSLIEPNIKKEYKDQFLNFFKGIDKYNKQELQKCDTIS